MEHFLAVLASSWDVLGDSAPYLLLGFFLAGLMHAFLPESFLADKLGGQGVAPVIRASLYGAPLPICSCGVLPAAVELKRGGAGNGAIASFLVATPETGPDSVAVTWGLLGPFMAVVRPVAAVVTGVVAGLLANRGERGQAPRTVPAVSPFQDDPSPCGCDGQCAKSGPEDGSGLWRRFASGMRYSFGELLPEVGWWFLAGVVAAGAITSLVPDDFFTRYLHSEPLSLLAMLVAGAPLYVCATASTPLAAGLMLKGLSPGAALVLLLAGPATNAASLTVIFRTFGRRTALAYLMAVAVCSLAFGWLTNRLFELFSLDGTPLVQAALEEESGILALASSIAFLVLLLLPRLLKVAKAPTA